MSNCKITELLFVLTCTEKNDRSLNNQNLKKFTKKNFKFRPEISILLPIK